MNIYDYAIPVSPKRTVYIQGPWPLTADEWQNFENVLSLFKPGLATEPTRDEAIEGMLQALRDGESADSIAATHATACDDVALDGMTRCSLFVGHPGDHVSPESDGPRRTAWVREDARKS